MIDIRSARTEDAADLVAIYAPFMPVLLTIGQLNCLFMLVERRVEKESEVSCMMPWKKN